ncbi:hypothetical protein [Mesorhizobium sp.]|nr:hypothetical protein [Mesorhizobium sp.]
MIARILSRLRYAAQRRQLEDTDEITTFSLPNVYAQWRRPCAS